MAFARLETAPGSGTGSTVDPLRDPRWGELLHASDDALAFHHPAWLELLRDQYGYEMGAWTVPGPGGALSAGLPFAHVASRLTGRRLVALPFSDLCPPVLARGAGPHTLEALTESITLSGARNGLPIEVRAALPGAPGASEPRFHRHVLGLTPDVAQVVAGFPRSQVRRGIAKAQRMGVTVGRRTDLAALDAFYALHLRTRRRLGVPTQPKSFIRRFAGLFADGLGFVSLATWEQRTIAAAVFLSFGDTLIYKYGASDPRYLDKRPNNALFMDAITWGCTNGHRRLDFGRTDLDNPGLRAFKLGWGAREESLSYTHFPPRGPEGEGQAQRWAGAAIRRLPPSFGRLAGAALYRHFG